jgi:hypothetical protein
LRRRVRPVPAVRDTFHGARICASATDYYKLDRLDRVPAERNQLEGVTRIAPAAILMLALTYLLR